MFRNEADALSFVSRNVPATTSSCRRSLAWNALHARYTLHRINHQEGYSLMDEARRTRITRKASLAGCDAAKSGTTTISRGLFARFAQETLGAKPQRIANGTQVDRIVALAMANKPSVDFCGYWQRGRA